MRLVLALVTLSHVSISSSLSVRASSYLVSLPYEHFSNTLDTRPLFTLILLETGCSFFLNNKLKKADLDLLFFHTETLGASGISIKAHASCHHFNSPCSRQQEKAIHSWQPPSHFWSSSPSGTEAIGILYGPLLDSIGWWVLEWMQINGNSMRILYLKTEGVVFVRPKDSTPSMRNEAQSIIRFDLFALNSLGLSSILS